MGGGGGTPWVSHRIKAESETTSPLGNYEPTRKLQNTSPPRLGNYDFAIWKLHDLDSETTDSTWKLQLVSETTSNATRKRDSETTHRRLGNLKHMRCDSALGYARRPRIHHPCQGSRVGAWGADHAVGYTAPNLGSARPPRIRHARTLGFLLGAWEAGHPVGYTTPYFWIFSVLVRCVVSESRP